MAETWMKRHYRVARRFGTGMLAPLPGLPTIGAVFLMMVYPIVVGIRNYRIGDGSADLLLRMSAFQLDVTWMHLATDIVATVFGTWCAWKPNCARCPIAPPWNGGEDTRRFAVPICKGAVVCILAYFFGLLPSMCWLVIRTEDSLPVDAIAFSMAIPAMMFAIGYAIGVLIGKQYAVIVALAFAVAYCVGGLYISACVSDRRMIAVCYVIFPVFDSGIGPEPQMHVHPWIIAMRWVWCLLVVLISYLVCVLHSVRYGLGTPLRNVLWSSAMCVLPAMLCMAVVAVSSPSIWIHARPFTPVCDDIGGRAIRVCSHPEDVAVRQRYTRIIESYVDWFPERWSLMEEHPITVLLGNSFTSGQAGEAYNLTEEGMRLVRQHNADVIRLHTDTIADSITFHDVSEIAEYMVDEWIPAPCAVEARRSVFDTRNLESSAQVTAFVLQQLPYRMDAMAGWYIGMLPGSADDELAQAINALDDDQFRTLVRKTLHGLNQCEITPEDMNAVVGESWERG